MIILPKRGLAYPGTAPRFSSSHPLAQAAVLGHGLACVANGTNLINLLSGAPGTRVGSPTSSVISPLGPTLNLSASGMEIDFSGNYNAATEPIVTFAAIFQINSLPGATAVIVSNNNDGTGGGGAALALNSSNQLALVPWGATSRAATNIGALSANIPYFAVASGNSGATVFVLLRLDNGIVLTDAQLGYASNATLNTDVYSVGGSNNARPLLGKFAAGMWAPAFHPLPKLVSFTKDPWSLWYYRGL